ncbi:MAG: alpha-mannosidase, partial [Phycisphaerales bacterium]
MKKYKRAVHLVCNSHLDPVWLWEWPEGAAEALAMARTAAELCDEFDGFIFNRNEAMFYEWIEEYAPALFKEIQGQVKAGTWHVMGGWYLQPDCNMPSGESFVRQILSGRRWFREKFGVAARTAANLDSFGHTRGLVQILAKSGYDSYIFCRPGWHECPVPDTEFVWVGYDGSEITTALAAPHYNCPRGGGQRKIEEWMTKLAHKECSVIPWGVGNHGGGPSRRDLKDLAKLMSKRREADVFHSTPEGFFKDLKKRKVSLPRHEGDLNPWAVGCYTTMARVKQKHRLLENELYMTEKMAATAAFQGLMDYPDSELREATRDLMISEFHDALAGTSIPPVEESTVQLLDHGLETVSRVRIRAFFALASGQRKARDGEFPILVYNPHPFRVAATVECELQPPWPHRTSQFAQPEVFRDGRRIAAQAEKAHCNINEDHRKRVVFSAVLEPSRMNRFDCRLTMTARKPLPSL